MLEVFCFVIQICTYYIIEIVLEDTDNIWIKRCMNNLRQTSRIVF